MDQLNVLLRGSYAVVLVGRDSETVQISLTTANQ